MVTWPEKSSLRLPASKIQAFTLHTDDETFLVIDHVKAQVVNRDKSGVITKITDLTA
jgi:hypothetical protein